AVRLPERVAAADGALGGAVGRRRRPPAGQGHQVPAARGEVLMTDLEERTATDLHARLDAGVVIPAHPLALDERGAPALAAQRALTRYQLAAGAHGLAVGVHTT